MSEKQFQGKDVEVTKDGNFKISNADYLDLMDQKGVSSDDIKRFKGARNELIEEGAEFLAPAVKESKEAKKLSLGGGDFSMNITLNGERVSRIPGKDETSTSYGAVGVTHKQKLPKSVTHGERLTAVQEEVRSVFK